MAITVLCWLPEPHGGGEMSTQTVYKLEVKSLAGDWVWVGPGFSTFPFLYESSLADAKEHYERLGLETRVENLDWEFDDR